MASAAELPEAPAPRPALALVPPARHFLFLQGLPGPFFRRLGKALAEHGALVSRVNFNGGDAIDWWGAPAYRGTAEDWPAWLAEHVGQLRVTDIVVFGDSRPAHQAARLLADRKGLRFHAFEEGYLRPDHVTLERGGVNGLSSFPRSIHALHRLVDRLPPPPEALPSPSHFGPRARQATLYATATFFAKSHFPHYRTHRYWPAWREGLSWMRRLLVRGAEGRASRRDMDAIGERDFFLFPLQTEGDAQLSHHSPFASMRDAMRQVVASFAAAPADALLLVKRHPLDPGIINWRREVAAAATDAGVSDRVHFVERWGLLPLLRRARGVVTVNSTVGPIALAERRPVIALGAAVYRVPGITADCTLEQFWRAPPPVDGDADNLMRHALRAKCLVNGSFHSEVGLARLIETSSERLLRG